MTQPIEAGVHRLYQAGEFEAGNAIHILSVVVTMCWIAEHIIDVVTTIDYRPDTLGVNTNASDASDANISTSVGCVAVASSCICTGRLNSFSCNEAASSKSSESSERRFNGVKHWKI